MQVALSARWAFVEVPILATDMPSLSLATEVHQTLLVKALVLIIVVVRLSLCSQPMLATVQRRDDAATLGIERRCR